MAMSFYDAVALIGLTGRAKNTGLLSRGGHPMRSGWSRPRHEQRSSRSATQKWSVLKLLTSKLELSTKKAFCFRDYLLYTKEMEKNSIDEKQKNKSEKREGSLIIEKD